MDEQIKEKVIGLLNELELGINFTKEQAPIIVEQLLNYELFFAILWSFTTFIILSLNIYAMYKHGDDFGDGVIFSFFLAIGSFAAMIYNITTIIKINIATNLFVLDYLRSIT